MAEYLGDSIYCQVQDLTKAVMMVMPSVHTIHAIHAIHAVHTVHAVGHLAVGIGSETLAITHIAHPLAVRISTHHLTIAALALGAHWRTTHAVAALAVATHASTTHAAHLGQSAHWAHARHTAHRAYSASHVRHCTGRITEV